MAGRYGSFNVNYTPMTYDDYAKPMNDVMEKHREAEDTLGAAEGQAALMSNYINPETDPETYNRYQNYMNELNRQSDLFSRYGLNPSSRRDLYKLNTMYNTHMQPIDTAYKRRAELAEEQRKGGNDMFYERNASDMSLDELIRNPLADYGRSISGTDLTKMVADAAGALNKQIVERPQEYRTILGGMYADTYVEGGFSPEAIKKVVDQAPDADPLLVKLVESVIASTGVEDWISKDSPEWNRIWHYAAQGLWNAAGNDELRTLGLGTESTTKNDTTPTLYDIPWTTIYNPYMQGPLAEQLKKLDSSFSYDVTNDWYIMNEDVEKYNGIADKIAKKIEDSTESYNAGSYMSTRPISNVNKLSDNIWVVIHTLNHNDVLQNLFSEQIKNFMTRMNDVVKKQSVVLAGNHAVEYYDLQSGKNVEDLQNILSDLTTWLMDDVIGSGQYDRGRKMVKKIEEAYNEMKKGHGDDLNDTSIVSMIKYTPESAQGNGQIVAALKNQYGTNTGLYPAEYDPEKNTWVQGNSKKELIDPNTIEKVNYLGLSSHGVIVNVELKLSDKTTKNVNLLWPGGIDINAENVINENLPLLEKARQEYMKLYKRYYKGETLTDTEQQAMLQWYQTYFLVQETVFQAASRFFLQNQSPTQKVTQEYDIE